MKLRTIAACMLAFGVCPFVRAQNAQLPARNSQHEAAQTHLGWYNLDRERAQRILIALQSPAEFLAPLGDSDFGDDFDFGERISPGYMRGRAEWVGLTYDPQWDRSPIRFYTALLRFLDQRIQALEKEVERIRLHGVAELSPPPPARKEEGPISVARDEKGRPIVTDDLVRRFLKAEYSLVQTGFAPWRTGNFTQLDYNDVSKRIEWARVLRRQWGQPFLPTSSQSPPMREQFSDEEVRVLNSRWRDLDNAQNGRWDEVHW